MEGIDLEQINALRAKLGIQPIPAPGQSNGLQFKEKDDGSDEEVASTLQTREAAAGDNWLRLQAEEETKRKRAAQKLQLKKQRDAAQRVAKLKGRGLGDLDEDEDLEDAAAWLSKSKKRQKKLEKERQKRLEAELAERERQAAEYTAADLSGLKVAHGIEQFGEEGDQILTLKDTTVGGDDEDELEDELEDINLREREKLEERLKSKKRKFTYDPNDTPEGSGMLSQYDDVVGEKKKIQISLEDIQKQLSTPDVTMANVEQEDIKLPSAVDRKRKKRRTRAAELARQLKEEEGEAPEEEVGLIIDETTEFVSSLRTSKAQRKEARESEAPKPEPRAASPEPRAEVARRTKSPSPPSEPDAMDVDAPKPVAVPTAQEEEEAHEDLGEEQNLNKGMGAVLNLLQSRGILQREQDEDKNALLRDRERFVAEKRRREEEAERKARQQRERDRQSGKLDRMSAREREEYARHLNTMREQAESRQMAEVFNREYKPDVQLRYVDEHGRRLDAKEAFKHLSHQFHGKGSGKGKTEKRLKKIEDEKKKESMSLLDTSRDTGGMDNAAQSRAKTNRQAGVRLQ